MLIRYLVALRERCVPRECYVFSYGETRTAEGRNGMQTIGLIGGMSWESTLMSYRGVNEQVRGRLDGLHSAYTLGHSH